MSIEHLPVPLIATGQHGKVIVYRDGCPPQMLEGHRGNVYGLSFCPTNPDLLASASYDKTVVVWGINSSSKIATLECPYCINNVCWSCDGRYITAGCDDKKCYVFDSRQDYKQLCVLEGHTSYVLSVAFHPQNSAVCATASSDRTVRVWQLSSGSQQPNCVNVIKHEAGVQSCCWTPDGKHLVTGGDDCVVRLWNVEDGTVVATLEGHSDWLVSVAVSPDGRMVVAASIDQTCRIWEAKPGGKCLQELMHPSPVRDVAFDSDGLHVVTSSGSVTRVWSIAVGKVVAELRGHTNVWSVAVPPVGPGAAAAASSQPASS